ncbi:substrate-binding domain-containing protein [Paenibacillus massiliensis]|uniref:substrate-binding domain-containing protein n=1 Tax=Paenibacillus massiliensis TaxID=225917 RepID=UPI00047058DE|nr:substrate-binding domain-containing protein [Paenibacillus massiliensis]
MKGTIRREVDCTAGGNADSRLRFNWVRVPLFIMLGLLLTSCSYSSSDAEPHVYRVALITPAGSKSVSDAVQFGAESAARELGAELITVEMTTVARDSSEEYSGMAEASNTKETANSDIASTALYTEPIIALDAVHPQAKVDEQSAQAAAVAHALELGATAIILNPESHRGLEQAIREVAAITGQKGKTIPVISLNAQHVQGVTSSISMNHHATGRQAGQAIGELLEGRGRVLLLGYQKIDHDAGQNTYPGLSIDSYALADREQGVREILQQQYPQLQVESQLACQDEASCQLHIEQWLHAQCAKPDQQTNANSPAEPARSIGMIALDESASIIAARSVAEQCSSHKGIPIVGFGSEREQLEQLQEGIIRRLIVHNGFSAGYLGAQQAIAYLNGEQVQPQITLETRVVSTENMFWMDNQKLLFPFVQ